MTTLIFARRDHPEGWGRHGHVTLFVVCDGMLDGTAVVTRMQEGPFYGFMGGEPGTGPYTDGYLGEWFGGNFDLIGSTAGDVLLTSIGRGRFYVMGDNRFVGIYEAQEVLS